MGRAIWAEQALLGAVLCDPAGQQHVLDLVRRDDMHRPWQGQVLAAMQRLRTRGVLPGPVDPVTISWEAARRGIPADPSGLAGGSGVFAMSSARDVHIRAVLARIAHAGRDIQASTADLALSVPLLPQAADQHLLRLERDACPERDREPDPGAQVISIARLLAVGGDSHGPGQEYDRRVGREASR